MTSSTLSSLNFSNTPALQAKGNRFRYFAFKKEKIHPIKAKLLEAQCYCLVYWLSPDTFERNYEATCSNELVKIFVAESSRLNPVSPRPPRLRGTRISRQQQ